MKSVNDFLRKLENMLSLHFFLVSIAWFFLRFNIDNVSLVAFTLAMVTSIRKIREYNFTEVIT